MSEETREKLVKIVGVEGMRRVEAQLAQAGCVIVERVQMTRLYEALFDAQVEAESRKRAA